MGKNLMLYLAVRNGILIIVGIGYLYKIVKLEFCSTFLGAVEISISE